MKKGGTVAQVRRIYILIKSKREMKWKDVCNVGNDEEDNGEHKPIHFTYGMCSGLTGGRIERLIDQKVS